MRTSHPRQFQAFYFFSTIRQRHTQRCSTAQQNRFWIQYTAAWQSKPCTNRNIRQFSFLAISQFMMFQCEFGFQAESDQSRGTRTRQKQLPSPFATTPGQWAFRHLPCIPTFSLPPNVENTLGRKWTSLVWAFQQLVAFIVQQKCTNWTNMARICNQYAGLPLGT